MGKRKPEAPAKTLLTKHRLQGYSRPEIVAEWESACLDLSRDFTLQGRKLKPGPLLNAVVLHFVRNTSPATKARIARWGLEELERALDGPETDEEELAKAAARRGGRPVPVRLEVRHVPGGKGTKGARREGASDDNGGHRE